MSRVFSTTVSVSVARIVKHASMTMNESTIRSITFSLLIALTKVSWTSSHVFALKGVTSTPSTGLLTARRPRRRDLTAFALP